MKGRYVKQLLSHGLVLESSVKLMDNNFCLQIAILAYQMANSTGMEGIQKKKYFGKMVIIFIITQYTVTSILRHQLLSTWRGVWSRGLEPEKKTISKVDNY